ncbi:MAG: 4Fe-4S binding protein, partial [Bdellovibrionales bacterium]|nr:4Fe-4S binding protein [Bdellovibrionales bacterium]
MSDDYREVLYTISKDGNRKWVYPQDVSGFFMNARKLVVYVLMAIYLLMPWIEVGGLQAVLLDLPHRKFIFLGNTFWATDTQFLFLLLGVLASSLFFFTALFGRIWCGWACPQTVFLEFLYRPIERLIEGTASQRLRLDQAPWTPTKIFKKLLKFTIFAFISWILASTALAYFVGRTELFDMIASSPAENLQLFGLTIVLMGV